MDIHLRPEDIARMPEEVQVQLNPPPRKPLESNLPAWLQGVPLEHRAHLASAAQKNVKPASVPVRPVRTPDSVPDKWWQDPALLASAKVGQITTPPPPPSAPRIVETHRVEIRTQVPPYLIVMLGFSLLATVLLSLALILLALK